MLAVPHPDQRGRRAGARARSRAGSRLDHVTLGALGVAISIGASLSTSLAGVLASRFSDQSAYLALAFAGLCGVLLLLVGMPETRPTAPADDGAADAGL